MVVLVVVVGAWRLKVEVYVAPVVLVVLLPVLAPKAGFREQQEATPRVVVSWLVANSGLFDYP